MTGRLTDFLFGDDEEKVKPKKLGRAKKLGPGGGRKSPPKKSKSNTAAGGSGNSNRSLKGAPMSRLATIAGTATGNNKAKKQKDAIKAAQATIEAIEEELPGADVVILIDGKVVGGDLSELATKVVEHIDRTPGEELMVRDADALAALLAVLTGGDVKSTKKVATAAWNA